jgi:hypothetical protein
MAFGLATWGGRQFGDRTVSAHKGIRLTVARHIAAQEARIALRRKCSSKSFEFSRSLQLFRARGKQPSVAPVTLVQQEIIGTHEVVSYGSSVISQIFTNDS